MLVLEFLNSLLDKGKTKTEALAELTKLEGIIVKTDDRYPDLYLLHYNQIHCAENKTKNNPMVKECRSLVLNTFNDLFEVESRSFDRFFTLNEGGVEGAVDEKNIDLTKLTARKKLDGTLINAWLSERYGVMYRTKTVIMPDSPIEESGYPWKKLIEDNLPVTGEKSALLKHGMTYIYEITSPHNRVVQQYDKPAGTLLSIRRNTGEYDTIAELIQVANDLGSELSPMYVIDDWKELSMTLDNLPFLDEGLVLYNADNEPVLKVKTERYAMAHALGTDDVLTPKRTMNAILDGDADEFISIFPKLEYLFTPYLAALKRIFNECEAVYSTIPEDRKEMASFVKDSGVKALLFLKAGNEDKSWEELFNSLLRSKQRKLMMDYVPGKFIVTVGASCSGKTTYAEEMVKKDPTGVVNVNRDDIRVRLFNLDNRSQYKFSRDNENDVTAEQAIMITNAIKNEDVHTIVISDTNLKEGDRDKWLQLSRKYGYAIEFKHFQISWKETLKRNELRPYGIPQSALYAQWKKYMRKYGSFGNTGFVNYVHNPELPMATIIDLDGTCVTMGDRSPFEWDKVHLDEPRPVIISMIRNEIMNADKVFFMSGRDEICYEATMKTIKDFVMFGIENVPFDLIMRPHGNTNSDVEVKHLMFKENIHKQFNVRSAFDDRDSVLRLWDTIGIPNVINVGTVDNLF